MKPTAIVNGCELYLGDCLDVLPTLGRVDAVGLVASDPPYNIGFSKYNSYSDNLTDDEYIALIGSFRKFPRKVFIHYPEETMRLFIPALGVPSSVSSWCYNSQLPRRFRLVNYFGIEPDYSRVKQPYKNTNDKRIKWRIENGSEGAGVYEWWDDIQLVKNVSEEKTDHPCPVPVALMERIILLTTNPSDSVMDPFMGSGTTGVACIQTGRRFIGIEKDPKYFEIACRRISQAQPPLFVDAPAIAKPEQIELI